MSEEYQYQKELESQRGLENQARQVFNKITDKDSEVASLGFSLNFIIVVAIIADIFGLVPIAGNFFAIVFGTILTFLYIMKGVKDGTNFNKKRWIRKFLFYLIEVLALGFSWLPLFFIEAVIDDYLSRKNITNKLEQKGVVGGLIKAIS